MTKKTINTLISKLVIIGSALLGVAAVTLSTNHGPGIGGDATIYIFSAKNLLAGNGLGLIEPGGGFRLIPYFPPFYSLVLAFFGLVGLNLVLAAKWLNILLFGCLVLLLGFEMLRSSKSTFYTAVICLLVALSPLLIPVYSWAMSEPLAIFLGFLGLILLNRSLSNSNNTILLIGSALVVGLSMLTRYSHVSFLMTAIVILLIKKQAFFN